MGNIHFLEIHKRLKQSGLTLQQLLYATENHFFIYDAQVIAYYEYFYLRYWDSSYVRRWLDEENKSAKIIWYRSSPPDLAKFPQCRLSFRIFPEWMHLPTVVLIQVLKSQDSDTSYGESNSNG